MPPLSLIDRLNSLPDECLEVVLSYLQPAIWQANPRLACKRLQAIVDCNLLRRVPLGLLEQAPNASGFCPDGESNTFPDLTTLAARFPHTRTLRRHASPGEPLIVLLQKLSALPDESWPAVTRFTGASSGMCCEHVQVLQQVARLCPNLEELQLDLSDFTPSRYSDTVINSLTTIGLHAWATPEEAYTAIAAALLSMPSLQRLQLTFRTDQRDRDCIGEGDGNPSPLWAALPGLTALTQLQIEHRQGAPGLQLAHLSGLKELRIHSGRGLCVDCLEDVSRALASVTSLDLSMG